MSPKKRLKTHKKFFYKNFNKKKGGTQKVENEIGLY
jgi:hypothetical protein